MLQVIYYICLSDDNLNIANTAVYYVCIIPLVFSKLYHS